MTEPTALKYAGFWLRLKAFAFDYLIILGYLVLLTLLGGLARWWLASQAAGFPALDPWLLDGLTFLGLVLPVALYFTWGESSPRQATWGKRRAGLRVVSLNGGRLSPGRALLRSLVKFLPWQLAHTSIYHIPGGFGGEPPPLVMAGFYLVWGLVALYTLSLIFSRKHRTPYDWLSGAAVVTAEPNSWRGS